MVVLKKHIIEERGQLMLGNVTRDFFYVTNEAWSCAWSSAPFLNPADHGAGAGGPHCSSARLPIPRLAPRAPHPHPLARHRMSWTRRPTILPSAGACDRQPTRPFGKESLAEKPSPQDRGLRAPNGEPR